MSRFKLLKGSRIVATADTLPEAEKYAKAHGCRVMQDATGRKNGRPGSQEYYYFQIRYNDGSVSNHEMMADEDRLLAWVRSQVGWRGAVPVSVTFNSRGNPKKTVDLPRANPSSGAKQRQRGTREDAGEGAGASLGWAAHYRQAAQRYKADPTEGDSAAAIEHHRQELEAVRQRYPSSRLPGSRSNPSKRDPDHDPKFWAGEWIGEIVNQIRDKASNVYYDEDFSSLEFDGRACSLGYDDKGAILVTKLSFDADDNMKEKRLKFGPSKSVEDGEKIVTKAVAAILARDNPSASDRRTPGASYLHLTDYLANAIEHEESPAAAVAYLTRCGYSAALASDVVAQCFSGHCDAQDAVDAAMARHGADLPYRSNSTIEVRRNGHHPAEKWAKGDRKPAIDFGEMGQDRQALAKWLQAHPGKTAAFKAAGTVYHSAQFDGQVFTVPASRKNGRGPSIVRDVTTIYPNRQAAESAAAALRSGDSDGWTYRVIARSDGKFIIAIHDEDGQHIANWGMRRNGAAAAPDPANFAEYQRLFSATLASQDDKRKRLRGDLHAMSIEGPTAAEKALERFIERIGPDEWDRVTQQALRAYQ